tara:strand:- start:148 stop:456 length:309 start_codon:yes stop_codon:yes gene_type:complete
MDELIKMLEEWRVERGISKTDMAHKLGTTAPQNYTNWIGRGSLPKEFYGKAVEILTGNGSLLSKGIEGEELELIEMWRMLDNDFRAGIMTQVKALVLAKEKK